MEPHVYNYLFDYEMSIIACYTGEKKLGLTMCNKILLNSITNHMPYNKYNLTMSNMKFYVNSIVDVIKEFKLVDTNITNLGNHKNLLNPSIAYINNKLMINLRCVNYDMQINNGKLEYKVYDGDNLVESNNEHPVSTKHILCYLNQDYNLHNNKLLDIPQDFFKYEFSVKGIEDIRIIEFQNNLYFVGTTREMTQTCENRMVLGKHNIKDNTTNLILLHGYNDNMCQKNWSPFIHRGKLLFVYSFAPLVILEPDLETGLCSIYKLEEQKYNYSNFRGGSQGFYINSELHFIIHEVLYEDGRKYYHRIVKFNDKLNIVNVTEPFVLEKLGIEYVAGAIYDRKNNKILVSYGSNDNKAMLGSIDRNKLNWFN